MSDTGYFEVKKHQPWLISIKDRMEVFCWLIIGEDSALLLDTGYGIGDLPHEVHELTDKPVTVVLSHAHADHAMGAYQFDRVYLHPADHQLLQEHCGPVWRKKAVDVIEKNGDKLEPYLTDFDKEEYMQRGTGSIAPLEENAVFDLGGLTVRVIPMPGHTGGSAGLLIPEHKTLLTGDSANRAVFLFLPESLLLTEYLEMLQTVKKLDFVTHYTGHQDKAYPKKWFDKYIRVVENALAGKGKPMKIPGFDEYGEILVSSIGGPVISPAFCAVGYTKEKIQ